MKTGGRFTGEVAGVLSEMECTPLAEVDHLRPYRERFKQIQKELKAYMLLSGAGLHREEDTAHAKKLIKEAHKILDRFYDFIA